MYLDANSLCEHPMIQLLPVEIRNWANQKKKSIQTVFLIIFQKIFS